MVPRSAEHPGCRLFRRDASRRATDEFLSYTLDISVRSPLCARRRGCAERQRGDFLRAYNFDESAGYLVESCTTSSKSSCCSTDQARAAASRRRAPTIGARCPGRQWPRCARSREQDVARPSRSSRGLGRQSGDARLSLRGLAEWIDPFHGPPRNSKGSESQLAEVRVTVIP
jgi:hypothetical protein